jgi:protein arginine kinase
VSETFAYDVFLSHSSRDNEMARALAERLKGDGLEVWLDDWMIQPGDSIPLAIEQGLERSRTLVLLMSQSASGSEWVTLERHIRLFEDPLNRERRLIPVRLDDSPLRPMLKHLSWIDWRAPSPVEYARLLAACRRGAAGDALTPAIDPQEHRPRPRYRNDVIRELSERVALLRQRRRELIVRQAAEEEVNAVEQELVVAKRRLRDGPQLESGECLSDRYLLIEPVGSGGFGTVWRAYDEEMSILVAIKVLHGQHINNLERRERFRRGAQAMQKLNHPNVVRVLEPYCEDGGFHYFVMEYVGGGTFSQAVLAKRLTHDQIAAIVSQVGDALVLAHERGIVHRDVTPDNILLDPDDASARLTDFDLVRLAQSTGGTRTGALGRFVYAAPESMISGRDVNARCDIYSLGMTAAFGYFGRELPVEAFTSRNDFIDALNCPAYLKPVLKQAVEHSPEKRFDTMAEFCESFRTAIALSQGKTDEDFSTIDAKRCPACGTRFQEFRMRGFLGCFYDYFAFYDELMPLLENVHGEVRHYGVDPLADAEERSPRLELQMRLRQSLDASNPNEFQIASRDLRQLEGGRIYAPESTVRMSSFERFSKQSAEWLKGEGPDADIIISSRIRLARNLACYPFPSRCTKEQFSRIESLLLACVSGLDNAGDFVYFDLPKLNRLERQFLVERQIATRGHADADVARSVFCEKSERLNILINEEDHLRIQATRGGFDLPGALQQARQIDRRIASRLTFGWHPDFGYVTASPANVGTGVRISVMLHLPGLVLTRQIEKMMRALNKINFSVRGLYGEGSEVWGDFFQFTNGISLGQREEQLVEQLSAVVPAIVQYERQSRQSLLREQRADLQDRIARAYGILRSAQTISSEETMHLLSSLRLGVLLGVIDDVGISTINELLLLTQPAHLQVFAGEEMDAAERNVARAKLLKQKLAIA